MVFQKTSFSKVLMIFMIVLFFWCCSSGRAAAANNDILSGTYSDNNISFVYYYTDTLKASYGSGSFTVVKFSKPVYIVPYRFSNYTLNFVAISDEPFTGTSKNYNANGVHTSNNGSYNSFGNLINDKMVYHVTGGCSFGTITPGFNNTNYYESNLLNTFRNYLVSDSFDNLIFTPNWNATEHINTFQLVDFKASIIDDNLVITWEPFRTMPYMGMQHIYVRYLFKQRSLGAIEASNRRSYLVYDGYSNIWDLGITIPLADLNISEGKILSSVSATPYFYIGDDLNNETQQGNVSYVYFDDDGVSSTPILVDPDIDPDVVPEDVNRNIFSSIQNFFSKFFGNLINALKSAFVPESNDILTLLDDMNIWFSERFGFIYYPFDLAIEMVGAFALDEADTTFTVPALTLNMMGGIKLWDSFEVDLDPVGFMSYVRFFTSVIMCCGTVNLAIKKWDEWIGGEKQ